MHRRFHEKSRGGSFCDAITFVKRCGAVGYFDLADVIRFPATTNGASERSIMNQTGHRSVQMVRRYIRDGNLFRENSGGKLGL
jgi:hypothetical protein